tara:strand:- start:829 stop:1074 length:246 start_codon:yes stop_codon:yes gene_type:complete
MIKLKSILTEDKDPSDVVLGKWAIDHPEKLSDKWKTIVDAHIQRRNVDPDYVIDYAYVVYELTNNEKKLRNILITGYNETN